MAVNVVDDKIKIPFKAVSGVEEVLFHPAEACEGPFTAQMRCRERLNFSSTNIEDLKACER